VRGPREQVLCNDSHMLFHILESNSNIQYSNRSFVCCQAFQRVGGAQFIRKMAEISLLILTYQVKVLLGWLG
jgi:hypothetical protein